MDHKLPRPLRGVITAMVTPLDQDLNLEQEGLEGLVEHLIAGGVHGIFILGTTGEAPNLPYDVRFSVIEQTCKLAGTRVPVIVGITDTDGNSYTCNPTGDTSCNVLDGGFGDYVVSSCCYRN